MQAAIQARHHGGSGHVQANPCSHRRFRAFDQGGGQHQGDDDHAIGATRQRAEQPVGCRLQRAADIRLDDDHRRQHRPIALFQLEQMGEHKGEQARHRDAQAKPQLDAVPAKPIQRAAFAACRLLVRHPSLPEPRSQPSLDSPGAAGVHQHRRGNDKYLMLAFCPARSRGMACVN
jgi:hypothetical protein